jgi:hypothetical protein
VLTQSSLKQAEPVLRRWQERSHPQELLAHSPQLRRRWQVAARTKTQSPLPSEDAVLSPLFGLLRRGQVTLRRLVGWQDLVSLKSQAAA